MITEAPKDRFIGLGTSRPSPQRTPTTWRCPSCQRDVTLYVPCRTATCTRCGRRMEQVTATGAMEPVAGALPFELPGTVAPDRPGQTPGQGGGQ